MATERHEVINDGATSIGNVRVRFFETKEIEIDVFSENDILRNLVNLENIKAEYIANIDAEIEKNNQMLARIRTVERTINTTE